MTVNENFKYLKLDVYEDKSSVINALDNLLVDIRKERARISKLDNSSFYLNYLMDTPSNDVQLGLMLLRGRDYRG